jgi:hypothetical protein
MAAFFIRNDARLATALIADSRAGDDLQDRRWQFAPQVHNAAMHDLFLGLAIFLCLAAAPFGSQMVSSRLAARNRSDETIAIMRLAANLFVVMTSLVLGLLINSSKNTFQSIDQNIHAYGTELILLDRTMRLYGPETDDARQPLITYLERAVGRPASNDDNHLAANRLSEHLLTEIGNRLRALTPPNDAQASLRRDAEQRLQKVVELRWVLVEQAEGSIPPPLVAMLVAWLFLIFASFGFRAPANAVVASTFVVSAALVACALYLILDMDRPFAGPIQVSLAPLERALAETTR